MTNNNLLSLFVTITKKLRVFLLIPLFVFPIQGATPDSTIAGKKIITIGNAITEIVFALGVGSQVIAVDDTSFYPPEVNRLPRVGYIRTLNAEGILALSPNLILSSDEVKPPQVLNQLKSAGVQVELFSSEVSLDVSYQNILRLGDILGEKEKSELLVQTMQSEMGELKKILKKKVNRKPRVLFILNMQTGNPMTAGKGVRPHLIFKLVGARSLDNFNGWKNLETEEIIRFNPEFVFYMDNSFRNENTKALIKKHKGFKQTIAIKKNQIFPLDYAYYFNLGPRVGKASYQLASIIHPSVVLKKKK